MPGEGPKEISPREFQMLSYFRALSEELQNILLGLGAALASLFRK
jgi:hypothetical protein